MKKIISVLLMVVTVVFGSVGLTGCNEKIVYQASTRFLYSVNGGTNWSETLQEVEVNTTYYLAIEMQITQSKETDTEKTITATVTIPNTNVLDCYLDDHPGVTVTGTPNPINNSISYKFNVVAGTSPSKFRVIFECTPLGAGKASIFVVYDDNVSESWDATGTIKYVSP